MVFESNVSKLQHNILMDRSYLNLNKDERKMMCHTERNAKNNVDEVPVDEVPDVVSTINCELTCVQDDAAV